MNKKMDIKTIFGKSQRLWILVAVMLVLTVLQPGVFLTAANMKSILLSISVYGIMVCGTIFPILLGGIDLSVGAVAAAAGAFTVTWIVDHGFTNGAVVVGVLGGLLLAAGNGNRGCCSRSDCNTLCSTAVFDYTGDTEYCIRRCTAFDRK